MIEIDRNLLFKACEQRPYYLATLACNAHLKTLNS